MLSLAIAGFAGFYNVFMYVLIQRQLRIPVYMFI